MKNITKIIFIAVASVAMLQTCKKSSPPANQGGGGSNNNNNNNNGGSTTIVQGTDPSIASTQGFFLNGWQPKTFTAPSNQSEPQAASVGAAVVTVDLSQITTKVSPLIFGNNTNPYMGQYVTAPLLMSNLTALSPNILRAPGGSLSDTYFWNGDGTPSAQPADVPDSLLDANGNASAQYYWYGNNTQSFTVTLDNYYKVLQQTNSTGLITVNYGYARYGTGPTPVQTAAHLAANWVRYDKGRTSYWEVGNELYGNWEAGYRIDVTKNKDGQPAIITGTLYGTHFKVFADSMRAAAAEVGNTNIKIGIVLTSASDATNSNGNVVNWNHDVLTAAGNAADFFVVHNYYTPFNQNSTAATILGTPVPATASMMNWVKTSVQGAGVSQKPVAMDEWNMQATGSMQNVSNIAGIDAVMTLGEVLKNQISMASRWDLANGWANGDDMGMFNLGDEPGGIVQWNARPAFYYMYFFQHYFGDRMVSATSNNSDIVSYGSSFTSGEAGVVLINTANNTHAVTVNIKNFAAGTNYYFYKLNGGTDNSPFSRMVYVNGTGPSNGISGGPSNFATIQAVSSPVSGGINVTLSPYSAIFLVVDHK